MFSLKHSKFLLFNLPCCYIIADNRCLLIYVDSSSMMCFLGLCLHLCYCPVHACLSQSLCLRLCYCLVHVCLSCVIDTVHTRFTASYILSAFFFCFVISFSGLFSCGKGFKCLPTAHFHSVLSLLFLCRSRGYEQHVYVYLHVL